MVNVQVNSEIRLYTALIIMNQGSGQLEDLLKGRGPLIPRYRQKSRKNPTANSNCAKPYNQILCYAIYVRLHISLPLQPAQYRCPIGRYWEIKDLALCTFHKEFSFPPTLYAVYVKSHATTLMHLS